MATSVMALRSDGSMWNFIISDFPYDLKTTVAHLAALDAQGLVDFAAIEDGAGHVLEITEFGTTPYFVHTIAGNCVVKPVKSGSTIASSDSTVYVKLKDTAVFQSEIDALQATINLINTLKATSKPAI